MLLLVLEVVHPSLLLILDVTNFTNICAIAFEVPSLSNPMALDIALNKENDEFRSRGSRAGLSQAFRQAVKSQLGQLCVKGHTSPRESKESFTKLFLTHYSQLTICFRCNLISKCWRTGTSILGHEEKQRDEKGILLNKILPFKLVKWWGNAALHTDN